MKINYLRGWHISEGMHPCQNKPHWFAVRWGVRMNSNSYDGIISMILKRDV